MYNVYVINLRFILVYMLLFHHYGKNRILPRIMLLDIFHRFGKNRVPLEFCYWTSVITYIL
jgi:hypothetical protein